MSKSFYTSGEAAKLCGLALSTLKRWIRKGALKSHRTPGGDLRIHHQHLIDFMREFDIPLQGLVARPVVMVCVEDAPWRGSLVAELSMLEVEIDVKTGDLELGYGLAAGVPQFLILQARTAEEDLLRCQMVRNAIHPASLRIGMVGTGEASEASLSLARPDVLINPATDPAWAVTFARHLLGSAATVPMEGAAG